MIFQSDKVGREEMKGGKRYFNLIKYDVRK